MKAPTMRQGLSRRVGQTLGLQIRDAGPARRAMGQSLIDAVVGIGQRDRLKDANETNEDRSHNHERHPLEIQIENLAGAK